VSNWVWINSCHLVFWSTWLQQSAGISYPLKLDARDNRLKSNFTLKPPFNCGARRVSETLSILGDRLVQFRNTIKPKLDHQELNTHLRVINRQGPTRAVWPRESLDLWLPCRILANRYEWSFWLTTASFNYSIIRRPSVIEVKQFTQRLCRSLEFYAIENIYVVLAA